MNFEIRLLAKFGINSAFLISIVDCPILIILFLLQDGIVIFSLTIVTYKLICGAYSTSILFSLLLLFVDFLVEHLLMIFIIEPDIIQDTQIFKKIIFVSVLGEDLKDAVHLVISIFN